MQVQEIISVLMHAHPCKHSPKTELRVPPTEPKPSLRMACWYNASHWSYLHDFLRHCLLDPNLEDSVQKLLMQFWGPHHPGSLDWLVAFSPLPIRHTCKKPQSK